MFKTGDKVRFVDGEEHECYPECYPPVGTIGEVLYIGANGAAYVQWPGGGAHRVMTDGLPMKLCWSWWRKEANRDVSRRMPHLRGGVSAGGAVRLHDGTSPQGRCKPI